MVDENCAWSLKSCRRAAAEGAEVRKRTLTLIARGGTGELLEKAVRGAFSIFLSLPSADLRRLSGAHTLSPHLQNVKQKALCSKGESTSPSVLFFLLPRQLSTNQRCYTHEKRSRITLSLSSHGGWRR